MALWRYLVDQWKNGEPDVRYSTIDDKTLVNDDASPEVAPKFADEDDVEGIKTEYSQLRMQRSRRLRNAAFSAANGVCCVCGRDFGRLLGGMGKRVLQVHHRDQLAARKVPSITKQSDLAVVCANCHLLLHLDSSKALSIEELREMLRADGWSAN